MRPGVSVPDFSGALQLAPVEQAAWLLQLLLIAWILLRRPAGGPLPALRTSHVLLVLGLAWGWRLMLAFVLASDDFGYWIGDDAVRFQRAWEWSRDPFFALPRDPWLAGGYWLHGAAMRALGGDALHASKLVSALCGVLPLWGVYAFARAVFGRREIGAAAVVLAAPGWIQVLLSTGTMTELPVTGLLLLGSAWLLDGLRAPPGAARRRRHAAGAAALCAATAFHLIAWIYLAAIQAALLAARGLGRGPRRLGEWTATTLGSGAFVAAWATGQWWIAGSPFAQLVQAQALATGKLGGSAAIEAAIYPLSVAYTLRPLLPLVVLGVAAALLPGVGTTRARAVLAGLLLALLALVATALIGGTNVTPYRTVAPLAAALVAFAAAAPFARLESAAGAPPRWPRPALALAAAIAALLFVDGHRKVFDHRVVGKTIWLAAEPTHPHSATFALGRYLRRKVPERRDPDGRPLPVRVLAPEARSLTWSVFVFAIGEPGRLEPTTRQALTEGLRPGQLVVAFRSPGRPGLRPLGRIGPYRLYEAAESAPTRRPR